MQKTEKAIDDEEKKRKAEAAKNFWITLGLTALAVVVTVATGGLASPLAVTLFAVDMAFSANTLIASGTEAITGHEFNPMVEGLKLTGMDDKTAAMVVNVASMSTIVVGGVAGGAKILGKAAALHEAGELGSTVMNGLRQIPKLPATAVKSVLTTASDIKTIAVNKVGSVLDRVSDKAAELSGKLNETPWKKLAVTENSGVRISVGGVASLGPSGKNIGLVNTMFSDTSYGGRIQSGLDKLSESTGRGSKTLGGSSNIESRLQDGDTFSAKLRGKMESVDGLTVKDFDYTKRSSQEANQLRRQFDSSVRKNFLKDFSTNEDYLKSQGFTDRDIKDMSKGQPPAGYQVHHNHPLDDSGTNDFNNLVLIKNEPYHKLITNYQKEATGMLGVGETKTIPWPEITDKVFNGGVR